MMDLKDISFAFLIFSISISLLAVTGAFVYRVLRGEL